MTLPARPAMDARGAGTAELAAASVLAETARLRLVLDGGDWTYAWLAAQKAGGGPAGAG